MDRRVPAMEFPWWNEGEKISMHFGHQNGVYIGGTGQELEKQRHTVSTVCASTSPLNLPLVNPSASIRGGHLSQYEMAADTCGAIWTIASCQRAQVYAGCGACNKVLRAERGRT